MHIYAYNTLGYHHIHVFDTLLIIDYDAVTKLTGVVCMYVSVMIIVSVMIACKQI